MQPQRILKELLDKSEKMPRVGRGDASKRLLIISKTLVVGEYSVRRNLQTCIEDSGSHFLDLMGYRRNFRCLVSGEKNNANGRMTEIMVSAYVKNFWQPSVFW